MRILVVEEERALRALLEETFRALGHEVGAVDSRAAALESLARRPPDVLVCDLGPPGTWGEEVAREAAARPRPPRIVLMSAEWERLEPTDAIADAALVKPFDLDELTSLIEFYQRRLPRRGKDKK